MMKQFDTLYGQSSMRAPSQQMAVSRFVSQTYGWMFVGLLITGFVSMGVASSEAALRLILENRVIFYGALIAEVLLVMWMTSVFERLSATAATFGFLAYSALNGVTLSMIFLVYTMSSIGQVFLISAGMFGGLAVYGTVTKKNLTNLGAFVGMGVWGLILVGLVNLFIQSDALSMALSVVGVLVFSGLTAYDAQRIRSLAYQYAGGGYRSDASKGAVFGALSLYLNFINLFLSLLRLFGNRRD